MAIVPAPATRSALPRAALQRAMTSHASVVRDGAGLHQLVDTLEEAVHRRLGCRADVEDVALTTAARAVAAAALERTESRGCHHRGDYPDADPAQALRTTVRLDAEGLARVEVAAGACL